MNTIARTFVATLITVALQVAISGSASADPTVAVRSEEVKYSFLELSTPEGTAKIYERIRQAAKRVCRATDRRTLPSIAHYVSARCAREAIAQSIEDIGNSRLSALHRAGTRVASR